MSDYNLNGLPVSPSEFLGAFFEPLETVCIRIFSDKADSAFAGQKLEVKAGKFDSLAETLQKHNEQGRGIYFVINFGGHEDNQISRINAQFMECDNLSLEEQLAKIQSFPLEPSLIVKTRKSLHCYWLMKKAEVERFRKVQRQLIAHFDADPACVNESRVFRLPGFNHCKEDPVLVECIKFNPELRYTQQELEAVLPSITDSSDSVQVSHRIKDRGTEKGLLVVGRKCQFIQHCKRNAKTLSEPDWYAMITNLAVFKGGESVIHKMSKPYPKYSHESTQAKINHFLASKTKPMTCKRIAECGYVCPKQKDGSCPCKSPTGLAYIPLEIDEVRKLLDKCKVKGSAIDDVSTARQFVSNYLYNWDSGLAETLITSEMKTKFGFKATDLKQLISLQKELYRTFSASKEARKVRAGGDIPAWYEVSDKGTWKFLPGVLADHLADNEHVIYCADSYYFYENGVYLPHGDKAAQRKVRSFMNSRYALAAEIRDAEWQWQVLIDKTTREINVNPYIMNFSNGLFHLMTEQFAPHDPSVLSTIRLGGGYNPEATCPLFLQYLHDVLPETELSLIQEIMGYFLVPINKAQKAFVIVGKGDSGKSTFLHVVHDILLGEGNVSDLTWQALDEKFATVQLFGKLANIFADLPSENIRDTGTFKAITGEDYISAQHKFKEYFSFKPFCRLLFSCNNVPKSYTDRSDGFYRRLLIIRFDRTIPKEKRDPNLKEKLAAEADGILAWSMIGLRRLIANSYRFSETERTRSELTSYKADNSSVLAFVEECCAVESGSAVLREEFFTAYQEYCHSNGLKPVSQKRLNVDLDNVAGVERGLDAVTRRKIWRGIRML